MEQNEQPQEEVVVEEEITTPEETTTPTEPEETPETEEETVTLSKSEFKKLDRKARAYDAVPKTPQTPKETIVNVSPERLERIELMQEGYSKEEVDSIMDLGGAKVLKNPLIRASIETMRTKAKSQDANQELSSKSPVYKKFTQADLDKMSSAELEKILPKE